MLLVICLFFQPLVALALAIFGRYLIFWFALHCQVLPIGRYTTRPTCLTGSFFMLGRSNHRFHSSTNRSINPWVLSLITLAIAAAAASVSWTFIEKPAVALVHRKTSAFAAPIKSAHQPREAIT